MTSENEYFGPFRVLKKVGHGALAEVWKVRRNSRTYALKRLKSHLEGDQKLIEALKREARALEALKGLHPFPKFYEMGEYAGAPYLLMEFINGLNLQDIIFKSIEDKTQIPLDWSCFMALEVGTALKELHQKENLNAEPLIHQDLKTSNVMVDVRGEIKVIDLGLGMETLQFTPLETIEKKVVTPYNDIFALGNIFYQLLHQKPLFEAPTRLETYFEMKKFLFKEMEFDRNLPEALQEILRKCLDQGSPDRYGDIGTFLQDLTRFIKGSRIRVDPRKLGRWINELKTARPPIAIKKGGNILYTDGEGYFLNPCRLENIHSPWTGAVDWLKDLYLERFSGLIHSIYLRGSVPRGEAIEGVSDLDSLAVLKGDPEQFDYQWVGKALEEFKKKFPFANYVEFDFLPLEGLLEKREYYSSRFILKVLSTCVYGEDLAKKISKIKPSLEISYSLYGNFPEVLLKAKRNIRQAETVGEIKYWCTWVMKRILRTGASLVIEREGGFSRELYPCYALFIKYYPERRSEMHHALELAINPVFRKGVLLKFLDTFGRWMKDEAVRVFQKRNFYTNFLKAQ